MPGGAGPSAPGGPGRGPGTTGGRPGPTRPGPAKGPGSLTDKQKARAAADDKLLWTEWWHFNQARFTRIESKVATVTGGSKKTGETGVDALAKFLHENALSSKEKHFDPKSAAALALGKIGGDAGMKSKKELEKLVRNGKEHKYVRESAALALGMMRSTTSMPLLTQVVVDRSQEERLRVHAAIGLGLMRDASVVPQLLAVLARSDDRQVHVAATIALGLIGDRSAASRVVAILRSRQTNNVVRACAATALGKIGQSKVGGTDVVGLLRTLILTDKDDDVRRAVALVFYRFVKPVDGKKVNPRVRKMVLDTLSRVARNDSDFVTRGFSMIALSEALTVKSDAGERANARALFNKRLVTGERREKGYAAVALGLLGRTDRECAAPLRKAFSAEKSYLNKSAVAIGLGLMKDVASKKEIAAVVQRNGNSDLRGYCCVALGLLGSNDPGVTKYLVEIVKHVNVPELKAAAAMALAKLGSNKEALDTLREALKDRNRYFKMSAIMAIGYFRDWTTVKDLETQFKKETNPEARAITVVALGYIGETSSTPVLKQISMDFNYIAMFLNNKAIDQIIRLF